MFDLIPGSFIEGIMGNLVVFSYKTYHFTPLTIIRMINPFPKESIRSRNTSETPVLSGFHF